MSRAWLACTSLLFVAGVASAHPGGAHNHLRAGTVQSSVVIQPAPAVVQGRAACPGPDYVWISGYQQVGPRGIVTWTPGYWQRQPAVRTIVRSAARPVVIVR